MKKIKSLGYYSGTNVKAQMSSILLSVSECSQLILSLIQQTKWLQYAWAMFIIILTISY